MGVNAEVTQNLLMMDGRRKERKAKDGNLDGLFNRPEIGKSGKERVPPSLSCQGPLAANRKRKEHNN